MSIAQQIVHLEALAACDAAIRTLTQQLSDARAQIDGVRQERDELQSRVEGDTASVVEMEKTRAELVQELRQIELQITRSRERLGRSRNEREVNAAERELDELRKLQRDRDGEVKKLVVLCEEARETIETNEGRCSELTAQLEGSLEGVTQTINDCETQLKTHEGERGGLADKLSSLTFRRYQSMHERGKTPIAKTTDGTCEGCFVQIPPMIFHRMLAQQRFEECENCHRILYYVPPSEATGVPSEAEAEAAADDPGAAAEGPAETSEQA